MLFQKYKELLTTKKPKAEVLRATEVDGSNNVWVAINSENFPVLLIGSNSENVESDLKLNVIEVTFARDCRLQGEDHKEWDGVFTTIKLADDDIDQIQLFLRLLEVSIIESGSAFSNTFVRREILRLAELFRKAEAGKNDLVGLWGELYVIKKARNLPKAVSNWCSNPKSKYDFVGENFILEVKATLRPNRVHRFSLDQLRHSDQRKIFVGSLLLVEKPSGRPVGTLVQEISPQIKDPDLRISFLKQCVLKGGKQVYQSELKLDCMQQGNSLRIYSSDEIPSPLVADAAPISSVKFDVDLTDIPALSVAETNSIMCF